MFKNTKLIYNEFFRKISEGEVETQATANKKIHIKLEGKDDLKST